MLFDPRRSLLVVVSSVGLVLAPACRGGGSAPSPASIAIVQGDGQSADVATPVPLRPTVVVRDVQGMPAQDVVVTFSVVTGGGSASPAQAVTDSAGEASTTWTLGPGAGANGMTASAAGLSDVVAFRATGTLPPRVPATIEKVSGDYQSAAPGTSVAVSPTVAVKDSRGSALSGVPVGFVVAGGGAVEIATASTDESGRASCGRWTLGPTAGLHALTASVQGVAPVTFSALAPGGPPDIQAQVVQPLAAAIVTEPIWMVVSVSSAFPIAGVVASAAGVAVALTPGSYPCNRTVCPGWLGSIPLPGQPRGSVDVTVTATDLFGQAVGTVVTLLLDRPPVLSVAAPLEGTVARPTAALSVACSDDDPKGCARVSVAVEGSTIAEGKDTISQVVDLSSFEGRAVSVAIGGMDSSGQLTRVTRNVFVESSDRLFVIAEVAGTVWDASGTRILFLDQSSSTPALKIQDLSTGRVETVEESAVLAVPYFNYGSLTSSGAIYVRGDASETCQAVEWRQGTSTALSRIAPCESLRVAGDWAVLGAVNESGQGEILRRDLSTAASEVIASGAVGFPADVAASGDVVYAFDGDIFRWRDGARLRLTSDAATGIMHRGPITDGTSAVYETCTPWPTWCQTMMHDGARETPLNPPTSWMFNPGTGYAAAGGWIAYLKVDPATYVQQVWRHGPTSEEQVTMFARSSVISGISPDGTVLFTQTRRFQAAPGRPPREIGSWLGRAVYRDGRFVILLGRDVLGIAP